jgi:hypothetical protein
MIEAKMGVGKEWNPRFPRHSKYLSNKALLSSVQYVVIAIGKPLVSTRKNRPDTVGQPTSKF